MTAPSPDVFAPSEEQAAIIAHPLSPLRVSAGAGTGKTTTIVRRLVAAVDSGLEPEEAVGITFTNKAAEELADRLRMALPAHAAEGREVEVATYHGFAFRMLNEFGAIVGVERDAQIIGPGYVRQLLHESVGPGPYHHLDLTALPWRIDEAAGLGGQLSGNLLEPDDLRAVAPSPPDDLWATRLELCTILERYAALKRELRVVDYGDLILRAHRLVDGHPELARRIRDRYRLVLLDEYQDTDPGQRELLRSIFGDGFPVTAVGDSDQTIYEWRGASLENFAGFPADFADTAGTPAPTLPLTLNRRSGHRILAVANDIRGLLHGTPPDDPLRPASAVDDAVACGWFRTAWDEATWIAEDIRRRHDEDGVPWSEIAILFRKNRQIAVVRDALHQADIPFEVASLGGLLGVPEVADIHAWLRVLERPEDSVALARILLGGRYRLGFADLAPLAAWVRERMPDAQVDDDLGYPLLEAVDRIDEVDGVSAQAGQRLREFRDTYRTLLSDAQGLTLVELVRRIIDAFDGWSEVDAMPPAQGLSARLNLYRFLDLIEDWSPLTGRPSLDGFLGYLDLLQEERAAEELDTARIGGADAVSLLTVHRAKGLEWDSVYLPSVVKDTFPSRSIGYDDPVGYARWLPYEMRLDGHALPDLPDEAKARRSILGERHLAQERRTAYVAVTRAQRRLVLTGAAWYGNKRPKEPSELFELAHGQPDVEVVRWITDAGDPPEDRPLPVDPPDPHFAGGWRDALRSALANPQWAETVVEDTAALATYRSQLQMMLDDIPTPPAAADGPDPSTSVTGLVTLASCPQRFYWSEIDRLPRRSTPWLRRGIDVHRRIELFHRGVSTLDGLGADIPELGETPTPPDAAAATGDVGREVPIDPYATFASSRFAADDPIMVETPIDMPVAGTRVRGRIDAVFEPRPGHWEIVDYKSGAPSDDPATIVQLQAYAVAAAGGAVGVGAPDELSVSFAYLGVDPVVVRTHTVDDAWLTEARTRIESLAAQVVADEFPATPSERCRGCDFTRFCPAGTSWLAMQPRPRA